VFEASNECEKISPCQCFSGPEFIFREGENPLAEGGGVKDLPLRGDHHHLLDDGVRGVLFTRRHVRNHINPTRPSPDVNNQYRLHFSPPDEEFGGLF